MKTRKIIINADDYGEIISINDGIIDGYNQGIISSTTVMANVCLDSQIKRLLEDAKGIGIGVHLNLTYGTPLTNFNHGEKFNKAEVLKGLYEINKARIELTAQIERLINLGVPLTHLDSHHHIHLTPKLSPLVKELAKKYNLKIRGMCEDVELNVNFYGDNVSIDNLKKIILSTSSTLEIMTHPGYLSPQLLSSSSYTSGREKELAIYTSDEMKQFYLSHNLVKATY